MTARPNSKTNGTRSLSLGLLTPILVIFAVIISSSCSVGAGTSQAEITELTVTINSVDYPITFDGNQTAAVTIPYVDTPPTAITVKTAAISAKASGLAAGDTLKISSGKADITITAEDGTTTAYTLSIAVEDPLFAAVQARSEITYHSENALKPDNYRTNILPFSIKASSADAEGEYRLAVRAAGNSSPTAADIRSSSAVIVRSLSTTSINVFLSFHMDTDLFDGDKAWTDNSDTSILSYAMVDTALLQPETEYKLYGVAASGSDTVYTLLTHSTDAEPALSLVTDINSNYDMFYSAPIEQTYTVRKGEPFLFFGGLVNMITGLSIRDSHYTDNEGNSNTVSLLLTAGFAVPARSGDDPSLFVVGKAANGIGRIIMISKNTHNNTDSIVSGGNFLVRLVHGANIKRYLFTWE